MSIFEAYDQEFSALQQEVQKNVSELKSQSGTSDRTDSLVWQIDALFAQSNDLIKQMEVEVRVVRTYHPNPNPCTALSQSPLSHHTLLSTPL